MRKHLLTTLLLFLAAISYGQEQVTNGDFENWTNQGNYEDPDGWATLNFLEQFGISLTTFKDDSSSHGNYGCEMISATYFGQKIPAFAYTGSLGQQNSSFGQSFHSKPTRVQFDYKSYTQGQDSVGFILTLTHWDTANNKRDSVAFAEWKMGDSKPNFTMVDIPILYALNNVTPDTLGIYMSASYDTTKLQDGNTLVVDYIRLSYFPVGINPPNQVKLNFYPNPASTSITFASTEDLDISVFSADGRNVINATGRRVNTADLPKGMYYMTIRGQETNTIYKTQKLIIQ